MPKEMKQVEIENSGYNVMVHVGKMYAAMKQALADGFQPGMDLPVAVTTLIQEMPGLLQDAQHVAGDLAEDKELFIKGCDLGKYEIYHAIKG
jgi:hypothetical protein